jgi:nifR3 family TIM-barrel protein
MAAKITRKGGGAAVPAKPRLLAAIVGAAVRRAGDVPVTVKCRIGLDDTVTTFRDTGRVAEEAGCAAIALHGRTAAQHYDGAADWDAIAELKSLVGIPVLGNGDIWEASDAVAMMSRTGCDGVVVGRGCLGRPWLFADLDAALGGRPVPPPPPFGTVAAVIRRHLALLLDERGPHAERRTVHEFRKHLSWYVKGYSLGVDVRRDLAAVETTGDVHRILDRLDPAATLVAGAARLPRGKTGGRRRVALPDGYLDDPDDDQPPVAAGAAVPVSGG